MTRDPLQDLWIAAEAENDSEKVAEKREMVMKSIQLVLDEDRACRAREKRLSRLWIPVILCMPAIFGLGITSPTPLVRAGYSLLAAGISIVAFAVWVAASWSRQVWQEPMDTRSQLQKTAFLLSIQARLARVGPLWVAPIFVGVVLIGIGGYQETGHWQRYLLLWVFAASAWPWSVLNGRRTSKATEARRRAMEELLDDLE